jgi:hypothetical protein
MNHHLLLRFAPPHRHQQYINSQIAGFHIEQNALMRGTFSSDKEAKLRNAQSLQAAKYFWQSEHIKPSMGGRPSNERKSRPGHGCSHPLSITRCK